MWTALILSLSINLWLLVRIPEAKMGGGVHASTSDERFTAILQSCHSTNPFYPDREVFGELTISSRADNAPDVFTMRFKPAANGEIDFRQDATVKWMNDKHIVEATTPYLYIRLDMEALTNHRMQKANN